jgi:hypothetical protein
MIINNIHVKSSPLPTYITYQYCIELQPDVDDHWWTIDQSQREITFALHMKTTGWIAFGISPGRSFFTFIVDHFLPFVTFSGWYEKGGDIGVGWIDQTGQLFFEVSIHRIDMCTDFLSQ